MTLDYFYGQAGELFSFYRIPKALFQEQRFQSLSSDAKTLYGILLDRMSLSVKNGWLDEQNRVFIIFTIEDIEMPEGGRDYASSFCFAVCSILSAPSMAPSIIGKYCSGQSFSLWLTRCRCSLSSRMISGLK